MADVMANVMNCVKFLFLDYLGGLFDLEPLELY